MIAYLLTFVAASAGGLLGAWLANRIPRGSRYSAELLPSEEPIHDRDPFEPPFTEPRWTNYVPSQATIARRIALAQSIAQVREQRRRDGGS